MPSNLGTVYKTEELSFFFCLEQLKEYTLQCLSQSAPNTSFQSFQSFFSSPCESSMTNLLGKGAESYNFMSSQTVTAFYKWGTIKKIAKIH